MSHSVLINVTKALMLDPALRCAPYVGKDRKCAHAQQWRTYQQSSIELPKVWSRKTLRPPYYSSPNSTNATLYTIRDATPYFPFCKDLYDTATTHDIRCDWIHVVLEHNAQSGYSYNFPCGCIDPELDIKSHSGATGPGDTNAYMAPKSGGKTLYRVPTCPTVTPRVTKKRKKKPSNLTDSKARRRHLRSKYSAPPQCSPQLLDDDDGQSDDACT